MSSMTRQQNKKNRQWIVMFNVSKQLQNMCSLLAILFSSKQKTFMRNHMFLQLSDRMINEFCTRCIELNNYLDEFPPFGPNQHFTEDKTKDILYNIIQNHWQAYMQWDKFDTIQCSIQDFLT
jgi:hypothetical protein